MNIITILVMVQLGKIWCIEQNLNKNNFINRLYTEVWVGVRKPSWNEYWCRRKREKEGSSSQPRGAGCGSCMRRFSEHQPKGRVLTSEHSRFRKSNGKSWQISPMATISEPWKITEGLWQPRQEVFKRIHFDIWQN